MVRIQLICRSIVCILISLGLLVGVALAQTAGSRIIAVFKEGTPPEVQLSVVAGVVAKIPGATILHVLSLSDSIAVLIPTLSLNLAETLLGIAPGVEEVIPDQLTVIDGTTCVDSASPPLKEDYGEGLRIIDIPTVHKQWNAKGAGMTVAVLDTGINTAHADLQGRVVKGDNVTAEDDSDRNGHGTHIAGIIVAKQNELGLIGGDPEGTVVSYKFLNYKGIGYLSDFCKALESANNSGIKVYNLSVGFKDNTTLRRTTQQVYNKGAIMVAAAGNRCAKAPKQEDGGDSECKTGASADCDNPLTEVKCPACYPWVLAVGATTLNDNVASYSCEGSEIDFVAPGGDLLAPITSTDKGGGYGRASGTSQAAAHAAAAVVLARQKQPNLSLEGARSVLQATAKPLGVDKQLQGAGRLDAEKMMEALPWKQK
jgi:subtilisin family serine protease